ncbi:MAG: Eco57I restriction-modification methylase domain-containing protein [Candidatus Hodarchaeales archaeon]|jgi:Alw26I/Eco31I/Esp3I family type II restriction m6 adenine DNA methyltransferase
MIHIPDDSKDRGVVYTPDSLVSYITKRAIHGYLIWNLRKSLGKSYIRKNVFLRIIDVQESDYNLLLCLIEDLTILDPSVGSGFFLVKALKILVEIHSDLINLGIQKKSLNQIKTNILSNNLYGVDISNDAITKCKERLMKEVRDEISTNKAENLHLILDKRIKCGNAVIGGPFNNIENHGLKNYSSNFNWNLEFPEIQEKGGFTICIGNPPWNILKPLEKEFYSKFDARISKYGVNKQETKKIIDELTKSKEIRAKWAKFYNSIKEQSRYFRTYYKHQTGEISSGLKSRTVSGDINLYKVFLERSYYLLMKNGVCGFLTPSGLHSDAGTKGLRMLFWENNSVIELISFENKRGIFPSIHKSFKFDLIIGIKNFQKTDIFSANFMQTETDILDSERKSLLNISWDKIKDFSPSSWSIIEFKEKKDHFIAEKLYKFPIICDKKQNLLVLKFRRELDITNDSRLFNSKAEGYPVYEGKMIEQFDFRFKEPRFWITEKNYKLKFNRDEISLDECRLVFRAVAASTNRRTMITTLLPPRSSCGNSLIIIDSDFKEKELKLSLPDKFFLSGIFNSFVFDYLLRLKVSQNLNMFIMQDMPLPRVPVQDDTYQEIVNLVKKLYLKFPEFRNLKSDNFNKEISLKNASYTEIRARLDALVAKIYTLEYNDFVFILQQFHTRDSKSNQELNFHKRRSLEIFKELP